MFKQEGIQVWLTLLCLTPYRMHHSQYFVDDLDDLLMNLDEGILHPFLEHFDEVKHREDRLIQMNEELAKQV